MHFWGDNSFDWKMLDRAIDLASSFMRRWGRIGVHSKEKYGTARMSIYFFDGSIHSIVFPGHMFNRFPNWLWGIDIKYISRISTKIGLTRLVNKWQALVYNWAYQKAVDKYPLIKVEIVCAADLPKLIKCRESIMSKHSFAQCMKRLVVGDRYDANSTY